MTILERFRQLFFWMATLIGVFACSRNSSETALDENTPVNLNGKWVGAWSWERSKVSVLEIDGVHVNFINFPEFDGVSLSPTIISSKGFAEPVQNYGPSNRPCLLVRPQSGKHFALYLQGDEEGSLKLEYSAKASVDRTVMFVKAK